MLYKYHVHVIVYANKDDYYYYNFSSFLSTVCLSAPINMYYPICSYDFPSLCGDQKKNSKRVKSLVKSLKWDTIFYRDLAPV